MDILVVLQEKYISEFFLLYFSFVLHNKSRQMYLICKIYFSSYLTVLLGFRM